jgi:hypothetical protein
MNIGGTNASEFQLFAANIIHMYKNLVSYASSVTYLEYLIYFAKGARRILLVSFDNMISITT